MKLELRINSSVIATGETIQDLAIGYQESGCAANFRNGMAKISIESEDSILSSTWYDSAEDNDFEAHVAIVIADAKLSVR